jgi:hypothetical protein
LCAMADDDDAWSVPTTTLQEAQDEPDTDIIEADVDHTDSVQGDVTKERWIKVFGFTNLDVVLQEFEKVGKIERYKPAAGRWVFAWLGGRPSSIVVVRLVRRHPPTVASFVHHTMIHPPVVRARLRRLCSLARPLVVRWHSGNWVHIKFARDYLQQFALEKDKQVIGTGSEQCMIGVVPVSAEEAEEEGLPRPSRMWRPHGLNRLHPVIRKTPQRGPNRQKPRRPPNTLCERIMRCIFG